jgi:hypothetical protein
MEAAKVTSRRIGEALHFVPATSDVTVPAHASLDITAAITLAAWIDFTTSAEAYAIIIAKTGTAPYMLNIGGSADTRKVTLWLKTADKTGVIRTAAITEGVHFLMATYDGDEPRIYVDNVLGATGAGYGGAITDASDDIHIGSHPDLLTRTHVGNINQVMIFNRALASWERTALYNQGAP